MMALRVSAEFHELLNQASKVSGISMTEIIQKCVEGHLDNVVQMAEEERKEAQKNLMKLRKKALPNLKEKRPTVDSSTRKLARKAALDAIDKVRGKKRKRAGSQ